MEGMWFKQCPLCRNYLKKKDPQEAGMCCACGWEEYASAFFCDIVGQYCLGANEKDIQKMLPEEFRHLKLDGK